MIPENAKDYKLFYVEPEKYGGLKKVYFTTGDITKEWGDDWDDAPWEHNAGHPYENQKDALYFELCVENGDYTNFYTCNYQHGNSPWSVEKINKGAVAWAHIEEWSPDSRSYSFTYYFKAGESLEKFLQVCNRSGIRVWVRQPDQKVQGEQP